MDSLLVPHVLLYVQGTSHNQSDVKRSRQFGLSGRTARTAERIAKLKLINHSD